MFTENNIKLFMGGEFTLPNDMGREAEDLAELFESWADEVKSWGAGDLSEVEIVKGKIVVTLCEGIVE